MDSINNEPHTPGVKGSIKYNIDILKKNKALNTNTNSPNNRSNDQGKDTENQLFNDVTIEERNSANELNGNSQLNNIIRVGHDYFEKIKKQDRYGVFRTELKVRKKSELIFDFGKEEVKCIRKFKDFILVPDNINFKESINGCFNLYQPFDHKPLDGYWKWTKILLEHVFGEQYSIGLKYIQALYQNPKNILPILALVSEERQTGKSTFIDWLTILFGGNMVVVDSKHLNSSFNDVIAKANIIAIEETFIEKSSLIDTIKALSTQKTITVNQKYVQPYTNPFYAKIIMASNNENKFIKIDSKEIRFFVRKLSTPKFKNHNILKDLKNEIPAFLHFLNQQSSLSWANSRQLFTADELKNNCLTNVKFESKSWLYHELYDLFVNELNNVQSKEDFLLITITDIKEKWFAMNNQVNRSFIRNVLKNEFEFENQKRTMRYGYLNEKIGKPYTISREYFGNDVEKAIWVGIA